MCIYVLFPKNILFSLEHLKVTYNLISCYFHLLVSSSGDSFQQPELYDFDHIHFDSNIASPVAILYGALGTNCFREFHVSLVQAAKEVAFSLFALDFLLLINQITRLIFTILIVPVSFIVL